MNKSFVKIVIIVQISVMPFLESCNDKSNILKSSVSNDTIDCNLNDSLKLRSVFYNDRVRFRFILNRGEIDGQFLEYSINGLLTSRKLFTKGILLNSEYFLYDKSNLISSVVYGKLDNQMVPQFSFSYISPSELKDDYISVHPANYCIDSTARITITKYTNYTTHIVFGDYVNTDTFIPSSDTMTFNLENLYKKIQTKDLPMGIVDRISGTIFFSIKQSNRFLIIKQFHFAYYFFNSPYNHNIYTLK